MKLKQEADYYMMPQLVVHGCDYQQVVHKNKFQADFRPLFQFAQCTSCIPFSLGVLLDALLDDVCMYVCKLVANAARATSFWNCGIICLLLQRLEVNLINSS